MEKPKKTARFSYYMEIYYELFVSKLLKNHEIYSFRLENDPDTKFYIVYRKDDLFWAKLTKYLCWYLCW